VRGFDGGSDGIVSYSIDIRYTTTPSPPPPTPTPTPPTANDHCEPNDDRAHATPEPVPFEERNLYLTATDEDWFRFTLSREARVTIETFYSGSPSVDTVMYLYRDGTLIAYDDDGGSGLFSRITRDLPPGTYYIRVVSFGSSEGYYGLRLRLTTPTPTPTPPPPHPTPTPPQPTPTPSPNRFEITVTVYGENNQPVDNVAIFIKTIEWGGFAEGDPNLNDIISVSGGTNPVRGTVYGHTGVYVMTGNDNRVTITLADTHDYRLYAVASGYRYTKIDGDFTNPGVYNVEVRLSAEGVGGAQTNWQQWIQQAFNDWVVRPLSDTVNIFWNTTQSIIRGIGQGIYMIIVQPLQTVGQTIVNVFSTIGRAIESVIRSLFGLGILEEVVRCEGMGFVGIACDSRMDSGISAVLLR